MSGVGVRFLPHLAISASGWIVLTSCAIAQAAAESASGFEVSGSIETISLSRTNRRTFMVQTDGKDVFIYCTAGTLDQGVRSIEFGTAGTNGFYIGKTLLRAEPGGSSGVQNDATLHIEPSRVPPKSAGAILNVWLVYAAYQQWRGRRTDYLPPRWFISPREVDRDENRWRMLNDHLLLRAEWEFDTGQPGLLRRFVDYRDGKWNTGRYSPALIPQSMRTGDTNLLMEVLSWTNVAGANVPAEALITSYVADTNQPNGSLWVRSTHRLRATHVAAAPPRRTFVPELTKATSVVDYRFSQGPGRPASYLSTNGVIHHTFEDAWEAAERQSEGVLRRQTPR